MGQVVQQHIAKPGAGKTALAMLGNSADIAQYLTAEEMGGNASQLKDLMEFFSVEQFSSVPGPAPTHS